MPALHTKPPFGALCGKLNKMRNALGLSHNIFPTNAPYIIRWPEGRQRDICTSSATNE
jgi:hypothetical protein